MVVGGLSPALAREHHLRWVLEALDAAGVEHFVVPGHEPLASVVAVEERDRDRVAEAITSLCEKVPGYLVPADKPRRTSANVAPAIGVRGGELLRDEDVVRFFTHLVAPESKRKPLGSDHGCDIEFWSRPEEVLLAPRPNRVTRWVRGGEMRTSAPSHRMTPLLSAFSDSEVNGTHPTLDVFLTPRPDEIDFPVDVVYTWVDDTDPEWRARKAAYSGEEHHPEADGVGRFHNRDELRFSLRSLHQYAPWVRTVHIVTDRQVPEWLDTAHPRVRVVDHRDIFDDPECLPTFNSRAIESRLHHIEGLADHFLYFNDDMLLARPVLPEHFFCSNGITRFFPSRSVIPPGSVTREDRPVDAAQKNNRDLIRERFGTVPTQKMKHIPYALRRDILLEIEKEFPEWHRNTARNRFRAHDDISIPSALHHHYAHQTARAVPGNLSLGYAEVSSPELEERLAHFLEDRRHHVLCINEAGFVVEEDSGEERARRTEAVTRFLGERFPVPGPCEKT
ncbi:stealth conserved region 3 domain-containing protein [Streptomyces calidiresistens]|uniref:Sugar phosphotransferase n=1 Tax=Streptomyces calidiresistens TaxID=1485586 RepID=A0A7W3T0L2_9ACTN|nr:stealth conserved region 3 domain-containing protein [Streptomyces calidiresistens]MBB0228700.1 sugar phosphotransferase [Streptomyces calidiresistens]